MSAAAKCDVFAMRLDCRASPRRVRALADWSLRDDPASSEITRVFLSMGRSADVYFVIILIVWGIITLVGHGTWVFLSALIQSLGGFEKPATTKTASMSDDVQAMHRVLRFMTHSPHSFVLLQAAFVTERQS